MLIYHGFREQALKVSHTSDRVLDMNDLSNPTEASAIDSAGLAVDPVGQVVGPALSAHGLAMLDGGAQAAADGLSGAVGQVGQRRFRSDLTNRCNCHTVLIECEA